MSSTRPSLSGFIENLLERKKYLRAFFSCATPLEADQYLLQKPFGKTNSDLNTI